MKKMRSIIVEDIPSNHRHLAHLLKTYCGEVEVSGIAETLKDAVTLIRETNPELVFLDIELPDGSGLDLLEHFRPLNFKVIFVTGHQEYAYQAIKFHSVDFLLKPVNIKELVEAVRLAVSAAPDEKYRHRLEGVRQQYLDPDKIVLVDSSGFQIISASDIIFMEASGNYTDIHLTGNRKLTYCRILKEFATLLKDHKFIMRTHRSYIVNVNFIRSYTNEGVIRLQEGHTAYLGDSYRDDFLAFFKKG
jgi:two-component system LytT family response regulator